jgi:hypothetical protein
VAGSFREGHDSRDSLRTSFRRPKELAGNVLLPSPGRGWGSTRKLLSNRSPAATSARVGKSDSAIASLMFWHQVTSSVCFDGRNLPNTKRGSRVQTVLSDLGDPR